MNNVKINAAITEIASIAGNLSLTGHDENGQKILNALEVLALGIEHLKDAFAKKGRQYDEALLALSDAGFGDFAKQMRAAHTAALPNQSITGDRK